MNSSLSSEKIASIKNVNLVYKIDHFKNQSVRDLFINFINSPLDALHSKEKYYHVLKDINFEIHRGERVGILGINGAGKTSLCRCIAGMIQPNEGKIEVNGEIRAIFDTAVGIVPELTGKENAEVISVLLYPEIDFTERKRIVSESLEYSELGEFIDVPYLKYSKGMQTRLSLSLVSAKGCDLLILDEVYDGADIFFQEKVSKRVLKMIEDSGAVIFVSHSLDQIEKVCNRLIVLNSAQIVYDGNVSEGIRIYRNLTR